MKVAMHNAAQKMLPIAFFLYIAVVTVDSENFGMSRTFLKVYLLIFYGCTARFKIRSVNRKLEPLYVRGNQTIRFFLGGGGGTKHEEILSHWGTLPVLVNQQCNRDVSCKPEISLESVKLGVNYCSIVPAKKGFLSKMSLPLALRIVAIS